MPDMGNEQLAGWAGGVSGFADALVGAMKEKRDREAAAAKTQAYYDILREQMLAKQLTGSELKQLAMSQAMNYTPEEQKAFGEIINKSIRDDASFPVQAIGGVLNNLREAYTASQKEKGNMARAKIKASTPPKAAAPKVFDPAKATAAIMATVPSLSGFRPNTPIKTMFKTQEEAQQVAKQLRDAAEAELKGYGREADFEVQDPFVMSAEPTFWSAGKYQPQSLFRSRKAVAAAPTPGAVPPPAASPAKDPYAKF